MFTGHLLHKCHLLALREHCRLDVIKGDNSQSGLPSDSRPLFGLGDSALMALLKRWTGAEYLSTGVARSERKKVEGNSLRPRTLSADVGARSKVVALTIAHVKK